MLSMRLAILYEIAKKSTRLTISFKAACVSESCDRYFG
ncbi:hypothetical protein LLB_3266 [Legionella longbeachae D-4968]|nr:hypothetical protein LLB_3266 [Legionella longbeachae D-4968]